MDKQEKILRYQQLNQTVQKGQIVFAGSSLMEMYPIEEFVRERELPVTVYNRGIGGFITDELLDNIDTCILDLEPRKLFINIGTNDLSYANKTIEQIMAQYRKILERVLCAVPDVQIYLMAYYPINAEAATPEMKPCLQIRTNERINQANLAVEVLAKEMHLHYIDINAPLKDEQGRLKAEYTYEGMHIKPEGYRQITPALLPYLLDDGKA